MLSTRMLMSAAKLGGDMGATLKSIQQATITLDGVSTNTATISEVDMDKSVCVFTGSRAAGGGPSNYYCSVFLSSSTQVTAINTSTTEIAHAGFVVMEFEDGIKSSQRGIISIADPATTNDATISAVDVDKAFLGYGGFRGYETSNELLIISNLELINSTTLRATRAVGTSRTAHMYFDLLEFE